MKNVMLAGVSLALIASGCTQLAFSKLQSTDEVEWRAALVEIQKDDNFMPILNDHPQSGPEKLGHVVRHVIYTYGSYGAISKSEAAYPMPVRKAAVEALGVKLDSLDFFGKSKVSELAFSELMEIYAEIKDKLGS